MRGERGVPAWLKVLPRLLLNKRMSNAFLALGAYALAAPRARSRHFGGAAVARHGVPGDGSCFFHALAKALRGGAPEPVVTAESLRRLALRRGWQPEHWLGPDALGGGTTWRTAWADERAIAAVARHLRVAVAVLDADAGEWLVVNARAPAVVALTWPGRCHFEPLCPPLAAGPWLVPRVGPLRNGAALLAVDWGAPLAALPAATRRAVADAPRPSRPKPGVVTAAGR
jgi:hypothetical protein